MNTRLIKWGVIAVLIVGVAWVSYQWGATSAREEAAEARTEAVEQAQREARAKLQKAVDEARKRARVHAERAEELASEVNQLEQRASEYASSDAGQQECLGDEGLDRFNSL